MHFLYVFSLREPLQIRHNIYEMQMTEAKKRNNQREQKSTHNRKIKHDTEQIAIFKQMILLHVFQIRLNQVPMTKKDVKKWGRT